MFITKRDYSRVMQGKSLEALTGLDASVRIAAELAAICEAQGYLSTARFDIARIFLEVLQWDTLAPYVEGDIVTWVPSAWEARAYAVGEQATWDYNDGDGEIIVAAAVPTTANDSPGLLPVAWTRLGPVLGGIWVAVGSPATGTPPAPGVTDWDQRDPRHPLVVMYVCDIAIWHMSSRLDPSAVPEVRASRYAQALSWLLAVAKGQIADPNLPLLDNGETPLLGGFLVSSKPQQDFSI